MTALLVQNGGHIYIFKSWALSLLKGLGFLTKYRLSVAQCPILGTVYSVAHLVSLALIEPVSKVILACETGTIVGAGGQTTMDAAFLVSG